MNHLTQSGGLLDMHKILRADRQAGLSGAGADITIHGRISSSLGEAFSLMEGGTSRALGLILLPQVSWLEMLTTYARHLPSNAWRGVRRSNRVPEPRAQTQQTEDSTLVGPA